MCVKKEQKKKIDDAEMLLFDELLFGVSQEIEIRKLLTLEIEPLCTMSKYKTELGANTYSK